MNTEKHTADTLVPPSYVEAADEAWRSIDEGRPTLMPSPQEQMRLELESLGLEVE